MDMSCSRTSHDPVIMWMTHYLVVSHGHVQIDHVILERSFGHVIGQVTGSPDISQGHVLEGLGSSFGYS
jgi:hypothetical protein